MQAVIGVLLGGAISLVTTVVVDLLRARRERRHFMDSEYLRRVSEFVAAANDAIGKVHDRGISHLADGVGSERFAHQKEEARDAVARLRVTRSNVSILSGSLGKPIDSFMERFDDLRDLADLGFSKPDPRWDELRNDLSEQVTVITAEMRRQLDF